MAPASNEEQFKFLISCIRYSNNGKVDFGEVAKECKIVSKGAAAKRYERMMRSHGIAANAATIKPAPARNTKTERRESSTTAAAATPAGSVSKKRKADQFTEDNTAEDDEEGFGNSKIKTDPAKEKKPQMIVKEESGATAAAALSLGEATNLIQFYNAPSYHTAASHLGDDFEGGASDYDSSSTGYHTPMSSSYGLQGSQQGFDFSGGFGGGEMGMGGMASIPRSSDQGLSYAPYQYAPDAPGGSESPVIVE